MGSYQLTWCPVGEGEMALGHRPGKKLRAQLEAQSCTLVVSLLSQTESQASEHAGRVRLPLAGAVPPPEERDDDVLALFRRMNQEITDGGRVFVHCSAGLHRTGMVAYAFLRWRGRAAAEAVEHIGQMRELTADELTAERRSWGDALIEHIESPA
ncbi:MAG: dual specificity protein phosphatase family protein [Myxococcales bacterium]|nr:dual specificity protein phosphatase family protein [Myxococcales bacterium]